ncbi:hypothetical protein [Pseudonocardia alni]|nr:hypothetical protein [Pseudonocardia alni]
MFWRWDKTFSDDLAAAMIACPVHCAVLLTLYGYAHRNRAQRELLASSRD